MSGELIRPGKALITPGMITGMRFLAGMCSNMTSLGDLALNNLRQKYRIAYLMFETVESPIAKRTLVRPRDLALIHVKGRLRKCPYGRIIWIQFSSDGVGHRLLQRMAVGIIIRCHGGHLVGHGVSVGVTEGRVSGEVKERRGVIGQRRMAVATVSWCVKKGGLGRSKGWHRWCSRLWGSTRYCEAGVSRGYRTRDDGFAEYLPV